MYTHSMPFISPMLYVPVEAGHHGCESYSTLGPVLFLCSPSPGHPVEPAIQCLLAISESLWNTEGISCGTVSFPSGLPALTANSLLFHLKLNERRRSFCLPNSQIQLLGRKYSVFSLLEENLIRLIALFI